MHTQKYKRLAHVRDNTFEPREREWRQKMGLIDAPRFANVKRPTVLDDFKLCAKATAIVMFIVFILTQVYLYAIQA
jgi:sarcosine oxidase delta subunit